MISKRKISTLTRRAFCCENKLAYHPWKNILSRIYFFFYEITLRNVPRSPSTFFPPKRILNRLKKISIHAMNRKQWLILFKERIYKIKIITKLVDCPFLFFFFFPLHLRSPFRMKKFTSALKIIRTRSSTWIPLQPSIIEKTRRRVGGLKGREEI